MFSQGKDSVFSKPNSSHKNAGKRSKTPKTKGRKRFKLLSLEQRPLLFSEDEESVISGVVDQRADYLLPKLTEKESHFFSLVQAGNLQLIQKFLEKEQSFNINCKNYQGYTAVIIAIRNKDKDVLNFFLGCTDLEIGEAFLHAIDTSKVNIVKAFLKGIDRFKTRSKAEFKPSEANSTSFPPFTTPLMLAAHLGNYEIIRLLLKRNHSIKHPHSASCQCRKCKDYIDKESISDAMSRLNVYRAISQPLYICQTSIDPIYSSFELHSQLKQLAQLDREFSKDFLKLAAQTSQFAVDLLDQCRNSEEVKVLLHRKAGNSRAMFRPNYRFTRVGLAIQHNQKEFVAHSSCQLLLNSAWLQGYPHWRRLSVFAAFITVAFRLVILPFMILMYIFAPNVPFVKFYFESPLQKYINHACSYIVFISLLMCQAIIDSQKDQKGPPRTGLEPGIILFVLTFFFENMVTFVSKGPKAYIEYRWNLFDLLMYLLFVLTFCIWIYSASTLAIDGHRVHLERKFWKMTDPTLIAEAVYSVAIVMALLRITYFYQIMPKIGSLQLSFFRLFLDITRFFLIFFTLLTSFAFGLFSIYHNYGGMRRTVDGVVMNQKDAFIDIDSTLAALYWALYGFGGPDNAKVVLEAYIEKNPHGEPIVAFNRHKITELIGGLIFGFYHIVAITILLNMLIAMMTKSFDKIDENSDVEWKFNRSRVWMAYLQKGHTLPPPFNVIPTLNSVKAAMTWIMYRCKGDGRAKCNRAICCFVDSEDKNVKAKRKLVEDESYAEVMTFLIQRYLASKASSQDAKPATKEDVESVRYYLRDLKLILLDREYKSHLKKSGTNLTGLESSPSRSPARTSPSGSAVDSDESAFPKPQAIKFAKGSRKAREERGRSSKKKRRGILSRSPSV